jgi:hypothetical protein
MSQKPEIKNITFENANIGWRNMEGRAARFNSVGQRNFVLFLDEEVAQQLLADGWNVAWTTADEEHDRPARALTKVHVRFDVEAFPCTIIMITSNGRTRLTEETVGILDHVEIANVDLIVRPYFWTRDTDGESGVKTMLKTMYFTVLEDELERKYGVIGEDPQDLPPMETTATPDEGPF